MASAPEDRKLSGGKNSRDARLKAALRENLRRRKAQARGREAEDAVARPDSGPAPGPAPGDKDQR